MPKQSFIGYMVYNSVWFDKDLFGFTLGGGQINNPGRYLVFFPINGETAGTAAINSPSSGKILAIRLRHGSPDLDKMPKQWITSGWKATTGTPVFPTGRAPAV